MAADSPVNEAHIALGSNLGDRLGQLQAAVILLLDNSGLSGAACSSVYETAAVGGPPNQPNYLNAVIAVKTSLDPEGLLRRCHDVEQSLDRRRTAPNAPRTIDLDILLFGDQIIATEHLCVPHPRMHLRRFVLAPLAEIAPNMVHPVLKVTIESLLNGLPDEVQWMVRKTDSL